MHRVDRRRPPILAMKQPPSPVTVLAWTLTIGGDVGAVWFGYRAATSYSTWRVARIWDPSSAELHLLNVRLAGGLLIGSLLLSAIGAYLFRRAALKVRAANAPRA